MNRFNSKLRFNSSETTIDISFDNINTSPLTLVFFKKDLTPITGIVYAISADGKLRFEMSFNSGLADGLFQVWNFNEKLLWQFEYQNGMKYGEFKLWHDNGQLAEHGRYISDKQEGICRAWHASGKLYKEQNYENGVLHGHQKRYYQNGHEWTQSFFYKGEIVDNKSFKHNKIHCWTGSRISRNLEFRFYNDYTNNVLESEILFFSIITKEGQELLKQEGLSALNKKKGVSLVMPLLKVIKKYYTNGLLKSEEISASNYFGQCLVRRTWNENGELTSSEKPNKNIPVLLLQQSKSSFDNGGIKSEEIKCYWKFMENIFYINFINEWYENGNTKLSKVIDSCNVNWINKEWDTNGKKSEYITNFSLVKNN